MHFGDANRIRACLNTRPADTAGFTDHLFALMHLLGYRFTPRIRNIGDTRLYTPANGAGLPALAPLIGGTINTETIAARWDEILRLAASHR